MRYTVVLYFRSFFPLLSLSEGKCCNLNIFASLNFSYAHKYPRSGNYSTTIPRNLLTTNPGRRTRGGGDRVSLVWRLRSKQRLDVGERYGLGIVRD